MEVLKSLLLNVFLHVSSVKILLSSLIIADYNMSKFENGTIEKAYWWSFKFDEGSENPLV